MIGPSGIEKKATGQTRPITSADLLKHPEFADALNIERPDTNDRPSKKQSNRGNEMRFNKFNDVVSWYERTKPMVS